MANDQVNGYSIIVAKMVVFPASFYFVCFCLLTYPLIGQFSSHLFADPWDGLQNVWNLWWVNKALTELHQSPWQTSYLHHPFGVSLVPHTLNPFNGLLGILLLKFLQLVQVYNFIVLFSFVMSGLTTFWLAFLFTRSYWASILAGFIFTFSSYHFAHTEGHLNLISLEWLPLFVLCWYVLIIRPGVTMAVASSITLFAVLLCDYYYFFYGALMGIIIFAWQGIRSKNPRFFFKRKYLLSLAVFLAVTLATSAPLMISLLLLNSRDPLLGGHSPSRNSMDAFAPFIPGSHWRFASLTQSYWSVLPGDANENSVYITLSVTFVLVYVWSKRRSLPFQAIGLWFFIFLVFTILALGPSLHVWGHEVPYTGNRLPYVILETALPPLRISGVPVRMMIVSTLSAAVLCAMGFTRLFRGSARERALAALLLAVLVLEYLPKPRISSLILTPEFVRVLKHQPGNEGVLDTVNDPFKTLYHQTIHEKPIAFGLLSRIPSSVEAKDRELERTFENGEYRKLYQEYKIRYLVMDAATDLKTGDLSIKMLYQDAKIKLYDLGGIGESASLQR